MSEPISHLQLIRLLPDDLPPAAEPYVRPDWDVITADENGEPAGDCDGTCYDDYSGGPYQAEYIVETSAGLLLLCGRCHDFVKEVRA